MGSLLKNKFKFSQTLTGIRERRTQQAFNEKSDSIDDMLCHENSFDVLSIARNLLVHKSGVADEGSTVISRYQSQSCRSSSLNQEMRLDGKLVSELRQPSRPWSVKPIRAVDSYISR